MNAGSSLGAVVAGRAPLLDIATPLVEMAGSGESVEVVLSRSGGTSVKVFGGEVESLSSAESFSVGIRVIRDGRVGFAHAGTHDPDVLLEVLADARDNLAFSEPDPDQLLATDDGVAPVLQPQLWSDAVLRFDTEAKIDVAIELERLVLAADRRVKSVRSATFGDSWGESALVSTAGLRIESRGTWCSLGVQAMASDGSETQIGYGYDVGRDPAALDIQRAGSDAVARSTRLLGATKPKSARVAIVCEPRFAATFMGIITGMCSGEAVIKGRSPFTNRVGEIVASPSLTLVDDPTDSRSYGAEEFDGEGLACRRNVLIDNGRLAGFLHNTYSARRAGVASTASAVRGSRSLPGVGAVAPAIVPGTSSLESLISGVELGLFVNSFAGLHSGVNPVSGDFSVGADGLMIRNGQLAEPVRELTLASTLQRMLIDIRDIGSDMEFLPGGSSMPSIVIDDMTMSAV